MDHGKISGPAAGSRRRARAPLPAAPGDPLRARPTRDLVADAARTASELVRKELELAKTELRADVKAEVRMASGLGVAGVCAICALSLALTAVAFALTEAGVLPGWAAALIVAAVVLAIGTAVGLWGWSKRVRTPLARTRGSIRENVRWAKERIA
jgi:uncharacterized membrane protein YqjE